jgi:glycosyltransferase involved in cell wall biosynthesis
VRLLVVSAWCPTPPVNGAKQRAFALLRELASRHEITLLTFAEEGEEETLDQIRAWLAGVEWVRGNPNKPTRPPSLRAYFGRRPASYATTFSGDMASAVAARLPAADAVLAFTVGSAVYFDRAHDRPLVFEEAEGAAIHGQIASAATPVRRIARRLTWWKYGRYLAAAATHFDAMTVVSEAERALLESAGAPRERVAVIPNGVDVPERAADAPRTRRLVYAGAPTYSANLEAVTWFASQVLPRLDGGARAVPLHVTGAHAGVDVGDLVAAGIVFEGHVADIRRFVASSAVAVVPLRGGGGTRLKILEAMAMGTPVVSTSKGAEGLDVRHGEHLLIADDGAGFARAVRQVLEDPGLAARLASAAHRLVHERYTWRRIGQDLLNVVSTAVARFDAGHA